MIDRRRFNLISASAAALLLAVPALAQSLPNVPRNKTLIVAVNVEAPVYRNVGLANPYSHEQRGFPRLDHQHVRAALLLQLEHQRGDPVARDEPRDYASDFTSFTVKLRDGVTWSDGKPFTADDVVYTLEMLIANGKGKKDLVQSASVADAVKGVTKIDPLTVKIDLARPDPRFAFKLPDQLFRYRPSVAAGAYLERRRGSWLPSASSTSRRGGR